MKILGESIKKDFPIFNDSKLIYLDNASTTQKPKQVLDAILSMYNETNANVHRALYDIGSAATEKFEDSRKKIAAFINASTEKKSYLLAELLNPSISLVIH